MINVIRLLIELELRLLRRIHKFRTGIIIVIIIIGIPTALIADLQLLILHPCGLHRRHDLIKIINWWLG